MGILKSANETQVEPAFCLTKKKKKPAKAKLAE
jgi:hypothetical protein